ncbi:hypothetical protein LDENG_00171130 [Lucifuga dentata]|nr:hypothetical protein LDENG_00171130 [Lucifuga dentata]
MIPSSLPTNWSTEDAISTALHTVPSHLDSCNTYARLLFLDFSSDFSTIIPQKVTEKLSLLGFDTPLCNWILDFRNFQTDRPQLLKIGSNTSGIMRLSPSSPSSTQGCMLSPLLFTLMTHFADDTTVVGLISWGDKSAYREEVEQLVIWCSLNNLTLNVAKTKEMVVDFRRSRGDPPPPLHIRGEVVVRVASAKYLGVSERGSHMELSHHCHGQEGTSVPILPLSLEESKSSTAAALRVCFRAASPHGLVPAPLQTTQQWRGSGKLQSASLVPMMRSQLSDYL